MVWTTYNNEHLDNAKWVDVCVLVCLLFGVCVCVCVSTIKTFSSVFSSYEKMLITPQPIVMNQRWKILIKNTSLSPYPTSPCYTFVSIIPLLSLSLSLFCLCVKKFLLFWKTVDTNDATVLSFDLDLVDNMSERSWIFSTISVKPVLILNFWDFGKETYLQSVDVFLGSTTALHWQ